MQNKVGRIYKEPRALPAPSSSAHSYDPKALMAGTGAVDWDWDWSGGLGLGLERRTGTGAACDIDQPSEVGSHASAREGYRRESNRVSPQSAEARVSSREDAGRPGWGS